MKNIIVIGGGAAGMAAAIAAAKAGGKVTIYEKNEKLGKKIYITGKGRCNVTNDCEMDHLFESVVTNSRFLYSAFYGFTNQDMMALLTQAGCPLKTERGGRVFPVSDKASDVTGALSRLLREYQVEVCLREGVKQLWLETEEEESGEKTESSGRCRIKGVILERNGRKVPADAVIVATGGLSYPTTGSDGDGYEFAREAGHGITELSPALVPFETAEDMDTVKELQGLALKNIEAVVSDGKKEVYREFGEMLFTHFGVSGPVLLSASSYAAKRIKKKNLTLTIDLKPALSEEQLDARILRDFEEAKNKQFKNALNHLFPAKLIPIMIQRCGISPEKKVNEITREERRHLIEATKAFCLTLTGLRGFSEAIITQGGVQVREINPSTMESKKAEGLYFAGEVLDLDAVTGGFNLQIAWSTGVLAGRSAAEGCR
ncbi:MAG: NAD(P)/FAD-dependent oxidoreductase [Clostridiaceae bacterium]|nr:NAD(P)/FAD-dependent oxidoreductase [Clostridiaceae bacterium]